MTPETLKAEAERARAQATTLAWAAQGDRNLEEAASHLLQAFHCINRAAVSAETAKAS